MQKETFCWARVSNKDHPKQNLDKKRQAPQSFKMKDFSCQALKITVCVCATSAGHEGQSKPNLSECTLHWQTLCIEVRNHQPQHRPTFALSAMILRYGSLKSIHPVSTSEAPIGLIKKTSTSSKVSWQSIMADRAKIRGGKELVL